MLRGEAGAGKTSLLAACAQFAEGRRVLRLTGIEAEAGMAWAAVHRLLLAIPAEVDRLPVSLRAAVGTATEMDGGTPDAAMVESAVLAALARASGDTGLVFIVDDLQWVDRESLAVLDCVAGRARQVPLTLVAAVCEPAPSPALTAVPELLVPDLAVEAGTELLMRHAGAVLDRRTAEQLAPLAGGNPLTLSRFGHRLAVGQADMLDALSGQQLPAESLPGRFLDEIRALPEPSQVLLTLAACAVGAETRGFWRAAITLGTGPDALAPAQEAHVVRPGPTVRFRHPLLRAAALACAPPGQWRSCHQALAEACDQGIELPAFTWHRAMAGDDIADALARWAQQPTPVYDALWTAGCLAQAARLSAVAAAADHYLAASAAALAASAPRLAGDLLHRARPACRSTAQQGRAQRLAVQLNSTLGRGAGEGGQQMLVAAARLGASDQQAGQEALQEAVQLAIATGRYTRGTTTKAIGSALRDLSGCEHRGPGRGALLPGLAMLLSGDYRQAVPLLRPALRATSATGHWLPGAGVARIYAARALWDDEHLLTWSPPTPQSALPGHLCGPGRHDLAATLAARSAALAGLGHLDHADQLARQGMRLARSIGWSEALLSTLAGAELHAWRGDGPAAEQAADRQAAAAVELERADVEDSATAALMTLHLSRCQYARAFAAAEKLRTADLGGHANQALSVLVEAGSRLGRRSAAQRALAELNARASASGTAWALGTLSLCEAVLASDSEAADCYERSITLLDTTGAICERARARMLYGEWLRRRRRRTAARHWLAAARRLYWDMGAVAFADRAQRELDATVPPGRRDDVLAVPSARPLLTLAERRIAGLAAAGATNKEIAVELFVSRRTVDHHLRNAYGKLGVSSRRQLGAALPRRSSEFCDSRR